MKGLKYDHEMKQSAERVDIKIKWNEKNRVKPCLSNRQIII